MKVSIDFEISVANPKQAPSVAGSRARELLKPGLEDRVTVDYVSTGRQKFGTQWFFDVTATWTPRAEP